jgi:hypothetical protein
MTAALLGWGGFTWRKAEDAMIAARRSLDVVAKVELKLAEEYVTKKDFELAFDRLFTTLGRFEEKLDYHVYAQDATIRRLRGKLRKHTGEED